MGFELDHEQLILGQSVGLRIKVVGVGRFGCLVINYMVENNLQGVDYVAIHSNPRVLLESKASIKLRIGAGAALERAQNRSLGSASVYRRQLNDEEPQYIATQLQGANVIILIAGMGKGTGTNLAPGIALVARNMGILTLGLLTTPFSCEGKSKAQSAEEGSAELRKYIDTLINIDNEKVLAQSANPSVDEAFVQTTELVCGTARSIADVLSSRGHINISFADFAELLTDAGEASIGIASASGEGSALKAVTNAYKSLQVSKEEASRIKGLMVNITGRVGMKDLTSAMTYLQDQVGSEATVINGYIEQSQEVGMTRATLIVTGIRTVSKPAPPVQPVTPPGFPPSLPPGIKDREHKLPAYIRKLILVPGLEDSYCYLGSSSGYKDKINKSRPETPAFERVIA